MIQRTEQSARAHGHPCATRPSSPGLRPRRPACRGHVAPPAVRSRHLVERIPDKLALAGWCGAEATCRRYRARRSIPAPEPPASAPRFSTLSLGSAESRETVPLQVLVVFIICLCSIGSCGCGLRPFGRGFHDFGKYDPAFDRALCGQKVRVDHSTAGAARLRARASAGLRSCAELIGYALLPSGLSDRRNADSSMERRLDAFRDLIAPQIPAAAKPDFGAVAGELAALMRPGRCIGGPFWRGFARV